VYTNTHTERAIVKRLKNPSGGGAGEERTLRAVLRETGGHAKVEELLRLLNAKEAAHFLGLSESTVRNMTYLHQLPHVKFDGRAVRYQMLQLIRWIEARKQDAES
jgi:excisionase family DNA binding protein